MAKSFRASKQELEKVKQVLKLKGWSQDYLAGAAECSRQTVNKFLAGRPVEKRFFQAICNELSCEWEDIADFNFAEEESSEPLTRKSSEQTIEENVCESTQEQSGTTGVLTAPAVSQKEVTKKAIFVLSGSIDEVDEAHLKAIVAHLQRISGDATLTIQKFEEGSIKITLEGSPEGIDRLVALFESGELKEVFNFPVEDVQLIASDISEKDKNTTVNNKFRLAQEIRTQGAGSRNLREADLSGANLSRANLIGADLIRANLSGADLIRANLSRANLSWADLSEANLSGANLNWAYLSEAYLSEANLSWAYLSGANLRVANLIGANLIGADLSEAYLNWANLRGANLSEADLSGADLIRANLSEADLIGANLNGADLIRADLRGAYLSWANLSGADLIRADLSGAYLIGANLSEADLSEAYLIGANLSEADLSGADVNKAQFGNNKGISDSMRLDLIERGAIFNDFPGDRSRSLAPK